MDRAFYNESPINIFPVFRQFIRDGGIALARNGVKSDKRCDSFPR